jgi:cyanuric acid amidohydrolase
MLDIAIAYPSGPGDVRALSAWLGGLAKNEIAKLVILGKTEGSATLNDFSRDVAQAATDSVVAATGSDLLSRTSRLFSTGCEGIASPVMVMMAELTDAQDPFGPRGLAIGTARSNPLPPPARCGLEHIDTAASTVRAAMDDAGLQRDQVALVLIKSPILVPGSVPVDTQDARRHAGSTGSSRGAAALGAAIALGEIDRSALSADPVGRVAAFATRAMAVSGIENDSIEVVVLGERPGGDRRWGIVSSMLTDWLDTEAVSQIRLVSEAPELIFFKAGIAPDGRLGGRRTTVLTSDLPADKQLRAAASGFVTAHFGNVAAFISGGTEHQAPPGGCICAALYRRDGSPLPEPE